MKSGDTQEIAVQKSLGADAAAIVSKSGFTSPAIEKAKTENIAILTCFSTLIWLIVGKI
jgi:formate dehydrogenase assembly factor FdhD